jgi:micrococcal nuclease
LRRISIIAAALLFCFLAACGTQLGTQPDKVQQKVETGSSKRFPVKLIKVIDGDTIKITINNNDETVRFLLIDTPESVHPTKPVQPFGKEASNFTKKMMINGSTEIELDVSERDKYGRLLAYVYVDGRSVQEALLREGLARVAYVYAPNIKYVDEYRKIQSEAQKKEKGIWSLENYASEDGYETDRKDTSSNPGKCSIKGNLSSSGDKIYHMPDGRYYDITIPEKWFCTEQEAEEAGFRRSQQ